MVVQQYIVLRFVCVCASGHQGQPFSDWHPGVGCDYVNKSHAEIKHLICELYGLVASFDYA